MVVTDTGHPEPDGWKAYWLTALAVLTGVFAGTVVAGAAGLFLGLVIASGLQSALHLSVDHAVSLTATVVTIPAVVVLTVALGMLYLRSPGRAAHRHSRETLLIVVFMEIGLLLPLLGVIPWSGGILRLGPAWTWLLGAVVLATAAAVARSRAQAGRART